MKHNGVHKARRVRCTNCGMIYRMPDDPLSAYHCGNCDQHTLVPVVAGNDNRQAALAVAAAMAGMAMAGTAGAVVGGIVGYLAGDE